MMRHAQEEENSWQSESKWNNQKWKHIDIEAKKESRHGPDEIELGK